MRTALVTGASRGLGAAVSTALALEGFAVALNYRRAKDTAESLRDRITAAGGRAEVFGADVTDEDGAATLCSRVRETLGEVEVLVLNATGPQPESPLEELRWQDVLDQFDFFVKSPLLLTRNVITGMKERRRGRIIHIGSDIVHLTPPNNSAYVAAKSAQLGLTRVWAREFGPYGITVNFVAPGWIPTDRHDGIPAAVRDEYAAHVPLRRQGDPADVGEAVAYLASDRAAFVTGQILAVNGGTSMV